VLAVGRVPVEELAALYRCAELFLFPSLYEGFGLPPLEAMACGTPVVASDRAALPETLEEAAVLCDPSDQGAVARAAARALSDSALRESLRRAGLERARQFSWQRSAEVLIGLFEEAAGWR
jgi:glycosyltransferase involved in cell wall biosynthesis